MLQITNQDATAAAFSAICPNDRSATLSSSPSNLTPAFRDVVVSCLVVDGRDLNTPWRRRQRRILRFDISLYFSLYFSSLHLMAVAAVTAQAWRHVTHTTQHLISHARAHTHTVNTLRPAVGKAQIAASCLQLSKVSGRVGGVRGGGGAGL